MYNLRVELNHYHSVKQASVEINGMTVLTGPNGSGKSTVARNLFYYLHVANNMERLLAERWISRLMRLYTRIQDVVWMIPGENNEMGRDLRNKLQNSLMKADADIAKEAFISYLDFFESQLANVKSATVRKRILTSALFRQSYEDMLTAGTLKETSLWSTKISELIFGIKMTIEGERQNIRECKETMKRRDVSMLVNDLFNNGEGLPEEFGVVEDGTALISKTLCRKSSWIRKVIYVDSPMAATSKTNDPIWTIFQTDLLNKGEELPKGANLCSRYISKVAGGESELGREALVPEPALYFRAKDGARFRLTDAATGLKTLVYLQRLIDNGHIGLHSLLMIDEPEAHLHPAWVVEVARVLVMIRKHIGAMVMVATHDPDMVSAIESISKKEGVSATFYLAEKEDGDSEGYVFRNCRDDISPIFRSFNVALTRIEEYGED